MKLRAAAIEYGWGERLIMRLLFAWVIERHIPVSLAHERISAPHGLGRLIDLQPLLDPSVFVFCRYFLWVALVLYVLRIGWAIALPYLALLSIVVGTVNNSQGAIGHHLQIVSLVLCAQTGAYFYGWWKGHREKESAAAREDRVVFWSQQAIVAVYLVSALTKLLHTSGMWFFQSPLVAVQIVKATDKAYYNRLDPAVYNSGLAIAEWIVAHPLLVGLVMSGGLLLELFAPLALMGRRWALSIGVALLVFHETVHRVMTLHFVYNEFLLWIYLVNVPFWIWVACAWIRWSTAVSAVRTPGVSPGGPDNGGA